MRKLDLSHKIKELEDLSRADLDSNGLESGLERKKKPPATDSLVRIKKSLHEDSISKNDPDKKVRNK